MRLNEDIIIHDTLNPKLFDLNKGKLLPKIREKIIAIVKEFEDFIEIPIEICDIQLVGSNCSFNWHDGSDVDICIVANFDIIDADEVFVQSYYWTQKTRFNKDYNITLGGQEVELYVQDVKSSVASNGIYSVCDNNWVKEPKPIKSIKKYDNSEALEKWKIKINEVIKEGNKEKIQGVINMLLLMRHNSIAIDGEYGQGNQLYKDIRNLGLIDKLKESLLNAKSKELSYESYNRGQLVNRFRD